VSGPGWLVLRWLALRWLAGGIVAMLLASGCSSDGPQAEPPKPHSPSTSPVTTTSPSPTAPALPAAARRNTKAGAVAFSDFYVSLLNHAAQTGDVEPLRKFSGARCESCRSSITTVENIYAAGGSITHYGWHVRRYNVTNAGEPNAWVVALDIRAQAQVVRESAGAAPQRLHGGNFSLAMYARWSGSQWSMTRMDRSS
jgi:hypothetical protein